MEQTIKAARRGLMRLKTRP